VGAAVGSVGADVWGRVPVSGGTEVSEAVWLRGAHMALVPSVARAVISIVTVALGVSLGREGAPQLVGAASASRLSDWGALPTWQRRLLVASGAGAGFAAVYNVPLGGTLFALEVLLGTLALPLVLPALATSVIATTVAWIWLGTGPVYRLLATPCTRSAGLGRRGGADHRRRSHRLGAHHRLGRHSPPTGRSLHRPFVVFFILGLVSLRYPRYWATAGVSSARRGRQHLAGPAGLLFIPQAPRHRRLPVDRVGGLFTS
jgi:H+/Cl- antiporter ClcA